MTVSEDKGLVYGDVGHEAVRWAFCSFCRAAAAARTRPSGVGCRNLTRAIRQITQTSVK